MQNLLKVPQELLLFSADAPGPNNPRPRDRFPCTKIQSLDHVRSDERPSPPQTRLTMHGNKARSSVHDREESVDDVSRRSGSIREREVEMLDARAHKLVAVILLVVEADDSAHTDFSEDIDVVRRVEVPHSVFVFPSFVHVALRPSEGHKLSRHDLMQVSVRRIGVVVIFLQTEASAIRTEGDPRLLLGLLHRFPTIHQV
mmetsp:Transcript_17339/g.34595  ORF Transcript_17339/g.34595 Transcript_17339/m.34595 type:complete len:200 (-) Transcript_17339:65-664(-)